MISLGYDNSRFKDFYDIYVNSGKYDFDGQTLVEAFKETFDHRGTSFDNIVAFNKGYAEDEIRLSRWRSFAKKKKISLDVNLADTIRAIKEFVLPVITAIENDEKLDLDWNSRERKWSKSN